MAKHREKHFLRVIEVLGVASDRFRDRLIDRLVESHEIIRSLPVERAARLDPQANDGGSKRAVLRYHFANGKTTPGAIGAMDFRRRVGIRRQWSPRCLSIFLIAPIAFARCARSFDDRRAAWPARDREARSRP